MNPMAWLLIKLAAIGALRSSQKRPNSEIWILPRFFYKTKTNKEFWPSRKKCAPEGPSREPECASSKSWPKKAVGAPNGLTVVCSYKTRWWSLGCSWFIISYFGTRIIPPHTYTNRLWTKPWSRLFTRKNRSKFREFSILQSRRPLLIFRCRSNLLSNKTA